MVPSKCDDPQPHNGCEMSRTPLGAGGAIYCRSRDNGGEAAAGGAVLLVVRAACGENQSMVHLAPVRAAAGGANVANEPQRASVSSAPSAPFAG